MIPSLLAITPADGRDLRPWIAALGGAGLPGLLLREPDLDEVALLELIALARASGIGLVAVHERNPAAEAAVGRDPALVLHRRAGHTAPSATAWGASCHDAAEVEAAVSAGAAYALLSPVWRPTSKPEDARTPIGPDRFLAVAAGRPVLALGGVTWQRHRALLRRGARGSAVLGSLFDAPTPTAAAQLLRLYLGTSELT